MTPVDLLIEGNKKIQKGIKQILEGYENTTKGCKTIKEQIKGK